MKHKLWYALENVQLVYIKNSTIICYTTVNNTNLQLFHNQKLRKPLSVE